MEDSSKDGESNLFSPDKYKSQLFVKNNIKQLVFFLILLIVSVIPHLQFLFPQSAYPTEGEISKREIVAEFKFDVLKSNTELLLEKEDVAKNVPILLVYHEDIGKNQLDSLESKMAQAEKVLVKRSLNVDQKSDSLEKIFNYRFSKQTVDFFASLRRFTELTSALKNEIRPLYREGFYSADSLEGHDEGYYFSIERKKEENRLGHRRE